MSDTGLYSGIYTQLRRFAEFLDDVLMDLKTTSSADQNKIQELGRQFSLMGKRECSDLTMQLVRAVLEDKMKKAPEYWKEVGDRLLANQVSEDLISSLESIAKAIERERAGVLAKMRGY